MADVKWIKITTDIFDDEKILLIESLSEADTILVIWFKLLCLAGKQNNNGIFIMANKMPYTDEMLSTVFRRDLKTVQKALNTFEQYGMIEIVDNAITLPNWGKHQNLEGMDRIREQNRKRQEKWYKNNKKNNPNVRSNVIITLPNATDKNRIEKKENRKEGENNAHTHAREDTEEKNKYNSYGKFKNVNLTEEEYNNLSTEVLNRDKLIGKLSAHIKSSGKKYNDHYATLIKWDSEDREKNKVPATSPKDNSKYADVMDNLRNKRRNRTTEADK